MIEVMFGDMSAILYIIIIIIIMLLDLLAMFRQKI